ncbi:hypothetical protein [Kamptonema formosum]|uniref:hypothetical protein n=1 Tax=Kamptonema formosum TaxID=331992 RepID=UPI0012D79C46|nr:hypothetical protein [Kamptonema formosum]
MSQIVTVFNRAIALYQRRRSPVQHFARPRGTVKTAQIFTGANVNQSPQLKWFALPHIPNRISEPSKPQNPKLHLFYICIGGFSSFCIQALLMLLFEKLYGIAFEL